MQEEKNSKKSSNKRKILIVDEKNRIDKIVLRLKEYEPIKKPPHSSPLTYMGNDIYSVIFNPITEKQHNFKTIKAIKSEFPGTPLIGYSTNELTMDIGEMVDLQLYAFLTDPQDRTRLKETVDKASKKYDNYLHKIKLQLEQYVQKNFAELAACRFHEINNITQGLIGNLSLINAMLKERETMSLEEQVKVFDDGLLPIKRLANQITSIAKDTMTQAKDGNYDKPTAFILNKRLEEISQQMMLTPAFKLNKYPIVTADKSSKNVIVYAVKKEFDIIYRNQLINAGHAIIQAKRPGKVTWQIGQDSHMIYVQIKDNGIGMDRDTIRKIYQPFFSTKSDLGTPGKLVTGTGLGMPLIKRILRNYHGEIHIESTPGKGTTITTAYDKNIVRKTK